MGKRILLVEDDRLSRESLTYLFKALGNEVLAVPSAEEGRRVVDQNGGVDVALLDLRLPGLSGDEFAEEILKVFPETRIIFISGEFTVEAVARFGEKATFFRKPVDFQKLAETVGGN